jgi:hypothetical protein
VTTRAVVSLAKPDRRVASGHKIRFRGTLGPTLQGTTVVVKLDGPGRRTMHLSATVSRTGTWTVAVRAPRKPGRWTAVAAWHGNDVVLADRSPSRPFRVVG